MLVPKCLQLYVKSRLCRPSSNQRRWVCRLPYNFLCHEYPHSFSVKSSPIDPPAARSLPAPGPSAPFLDGDLGLSEASQDEEWEDESESSYGGETDVDILDSRVVEFKNDLHKIKTAIRAIRAAGLRLCPECVNELEDKFHFLDMGMFEDFEQTQYHP